MSKMLIFILVLLFHHDFAIEINGSRSNLTYEKYLLLPRRYDLYCKDVLDSCSGHGQCLLEKCFCQPGWKGDICQEKNFEFTPESCVPVQCRSEENGPLTCTEFPSDACEYNPNYGVLQVSYQRWKAAQMVELQFWEGQTETTTEDRNSEHLFHFNYYQALKDFGHTNLGNILEFAAGPYTQTKSLIQSMVGGSLSSITLLEPQMMEYKANVPGCSYKDNTLFGFTVNFLVGRAEDFVQSEAYDTVIMINTIEHCQNGAEVLHNLYHSIKPGGILIWHERAFELYEGKPYVYHSNLLDFMFHPLRLKQRFWQWFISEHFTQLYFKVEEDTTQQPSQTMLYFIGQKPLIDKGAEYIINL